MHKIVTTISFLAELLFVSVWDVGLKEKEGRDFPLGNVSGTGATTSGIGFTTCRIMKVQKNLSVWEQEWKWYLHHREYKESGK